MKTFLAKARLAVCLLIIAAFFLPAYNGVSGFSFISLAFNEAQEHNGVTITDVFFLIVPLVLVPVAATVIFVRSYLRVATKKIFTALPLVLLSFFMALLIISSRNENGSLSSVKTLLYMQPGFYVGLLASGMLILTRNLRRKKHRRRRSAAPSETAAIVA